MANNNSKSNINARWTVNVAIDTYVGQDQDGVPCEHDAAYLVATDQDGVRYAHFMNFTTEALGRGGVREAIDKLYVRVVEASSVGRWAGPVGSAHWSEIQPAYGSKAYRLNQQGYEAETELMDRTGELGGGAFDSLPDTMKAAL